MGRQYLKVIGITWVMIGVCLGLPVSEASTSSHQKSSLQGVEGIWVKEPDFRSLNGGEVFEFSGKQLQRGAISQLQDAGIPILDPVKSQSYSQGPYLTIQGAISKIAQDYFAYTIMVEFHQEATLHPKSHQTSVVTWSTGALSTGGMDLFHQRIQILLDQFIRDFVEMNSLGFDIYQTSSSPRVL